MLVYGNQCVAFFDSRSSTWTGEINAIGQQASVVLHPRDAVVRNLKFRFLLEIDPGQNYRSRGEQNQQAGDKTKLEFPVHGPQRRSRLIQRTLPRGKLSTFAATRWDMRGLLSAVETLTSTIIEA